MGSYCRKSSHQALALRLGVTPRTDTRCPAMACQRWLKMVWSRYVPQSFILSADERSCVFPCSYLGLGVVQLLVSLVQQVPNSVEVPCFKIYSRGWGPQFRSSNARSMCGCFHLEHQYHLLTGRHLTFWLVFFAA